MTSAQSGYSNICCFNTLGFRAWAAETVPYCWTVYAIGCSNCISVYYFQKLI